MKRFIYIVMLTLLCLGISGCQKEKPIPEASDGNYKIFYLNASRTKLVPFDYQTQTTNRDTLIGELAGQILEAPEKPEYQGILGEKVVLLDIKKEDNILYLNFNKDYAGMKPTREILCRAALAKTFTQVDGVDYININCDGQPLLDKKGNPVGAFSALDFAESITDVNAYERVELKLYFANETKDGLTAETREVVHHVNTSLEKLVVEQLMEGPMQPGDFPVLPKDAKLLNVSLSDTICYVNFDSRFTSGESDVAEYIPIYAIVNSLTELQTVNKVQITVNGSADIMYRDAISLAAPLERSEKYIMGGK
ncbi:MAG: GerMN domain-containing protein [Clostridium sp.]